MKKVSVLLIAFLISLFIFFAYSNFNLFPEKEKGIFTVKIYYINGREVVKSYILPLSTKLSLMNNNSRSSLLSIWFHSNKPFGMKYGYLEMGVNNFELISIKKVEQ